jgi:hypothetical protein
LIFQSVRADVRERQSQFAIGTMMEEEI